ncbi:MAG TPA: hypothetical protein VIY48_00170 [Candidatus Paceibacterota bacterium]
MKSYEEKATQYHDDIEPILEIVRSLPYEQAERLVIAIEHLHNVALEVDPTAKVAIFLTDGLLDIVDIVRGEQ